MPVILITMTLRSWSSAKRYYCIFAMLPKAPEFHVRRTPKQLGIKAILPFWHTNILSPGYNAWYHDTRGDFQNGAKSENDKAHLIGITYACFPNALAPPSTPHLLGYNLITWLCIRPFIQSTDIFIRNKSWWTCIVYSYAMSLFWSLTYRVIFLSPVW